MVADLGMAIDFPCFQESIQVVLGERHIARLGVAKVERWCCLRPRLGGGVIRQSTASRPSVARMPFEKAGSRREGGWNWVGVVSGLFNPNDSGVAALERRPRHGEGYHEGGGCGRRSSAFG
jgi:hypothetical protein